VAVTVGRMFTTKRMTTALAVVALSGLLGACGSSGDDSAGDSGGEGESAAQDATLEFAQCMRDQGIEDFPDPEVGENGEMQLSTPEGGDRAGFEAAEEECRPILDEARSQGEQASPEERAERHDQALALAECMREKGWDMPDPEVDEGGGIAIQNPDGIGGPGNDRFEQFEEDMTGCNEEAGIEAPEGGGELNTETEGDGGTSGGGA
jgi:hypothetical protein